MISAENEYGLQEFDVIASSLEVGQAAVMTQIPLTLKSNVGQVRRVVMALRVFSVHVLGGDCRHRRL